MRRALLIGINDYKQPVPKLNGCVNDAKTIRDVLAKNHDESPNFACKLLTSDEKIVTQSLLRKEIQNFFRDPADILLFFFAGHGFENQLGGSLVTQDVERYDEGIMMSEIIGWAENAIETNHVREIILMLDCCHSGHFGTTMMGDRRAILPEGISILTSSASYQNSAEQGRNGLFTSIIEEALLGGASDMTGKVTVADLYSFADQLLGPWQQRPTFKTHITHLSTLRQCRPRTESWMLRKMTDYFPDPDFIYPLDPSYESTHELQNTEHEEIFSNLQIYRSCGLLVPVGAEHLFYAAIKSKACELTPLGKFYWKLVKAGKI